MNSDLSRSGFTRRTADLTTTSCSPSHLTMTSRRRPRTHEIGLKFAEYFPGFQVLVATHINTKAIQELLCKG